MNVLQIEDRELLLNNKGKIRDFQVDPLSLWVFVQIECVDLHENEENIIQLDLTYKDGFIYVLSGDYLSRFDQFSLDKDVIIVFVRNLLNQPFLLDEFDYYYKHLLEDDSHKSWNSYLEYFKKMSQLIGVKSENIQLDPKEIKKLNAIRLKRITGVEDEWN